MAVVTDCRGERGDPAAANGLLHTRRAGRLDPPMLAPAEPRWAQLLFAVAPGLDLRDRFRGVLIGGVIGDAMGRANEGGRPSEVGERQIRNYQPWHGWRSGPKGTITDDTQMTMWLAESILDAASRAMEVGAPDVRDRLRIPRISPSVSPASPSGESGRPLGNLSTT